MAEDIVLITGASGFLASHIILKLLACGYRVRGSVRNVEKGAHIEQVLARHGVDLGRFSLVSLDLLKDEGWKEAMQDVRYLMHTASPFVITAPKDPDVIVKPAVEGTRRAMAAALEAGVERIVLTSSMVAVVFGHGNVGGRAFTEHDWTNVDSPEVTPYYRSKTLAEQEAWHMVDVAACRERLAVVNPGFILGPLLEEDIGTSGAIVARMMKGDFPGSPNIYFACVDVRDVADLHVALMTSSSAGGRRFLLGDASVSLPEMASMLAAHFPAYRRKLPTRRLPDLLVRFVSLFDGDMKTAVRMLGVRHELDSKPAREILQHPLVTTEEALQAMAQSLIDMELI